MRTTIILSIFPLNNAILVYLSVIVSVDILLGDYWTRYGYFTHVITTNTPKTTIVIVIHVVALCTSVCLLLLLLVFTSSNRCFLIAIFYFFLITRTTEILHSNRL